MNIALKYILDKATDETYYKNYDMSHKALDEIYAKLIVIPIQKSWRSKSPEEKIKLANTIEKNIYKECIECNTFMKNSAFITCMDCYLGEKYRGYTSD